MIFQSIEPLALDVECLCVTSAFNRTFNYKLTCFSTFIPQSLFKRKSQKLKCWAVRHYVKLFCDVYFALYSWLVG